VSCPAKAGHTVDCATSVITGTSAFADDDSMQRRRMGADGPLFPRTFEVISRSLSPRNRSARTLIAPHLIRPFTPRDRTSRIQSPTNESRTKTLAAQPETRPRRRGADLARLGCPTAASTSSASTAGNLHDATAPRYQAGQWRVLRGSSETAGRPSQEPSCPRLEMAPDRACPVAAR
jgi:hypothetical protein